MSTRAFSWGRSGLAVLSLLGVVFVLSRGACGSGSGPEARSRGKRAEGEQSGRQVRDGEPRVLGIAGREADPASMMRAIRHAGGWYVRDGRSLADQPVKSLDDEAPEIMEALRSPDEALKKAQNYCLSKHRFTAPCRFAPSVGIAPGGEVVFARAEAFVPEWEESGEVEAACDEFADCFAREGLLGKRFDGFAASEALVASTTWSLIPLSREEYRRQLTGSVALLTSELAALRGSGDAERIEALTRELESLQRDLEAHGD